MKEMDSAALTNVLLLVPVFLFALSFHEYAHAWVAFRRGDPTAFEMGRLSMHPLAHADLVGTLLLPIICISQGWPFIDWAKPVPVNYSKLKNRKWDSALVALAGPGANILLSIVATALLAVLLRTPMEHKILETVQLLTVISIQINLMLAFFNLIPIPPLDGFLVAQAFVPGRFSNILRTLTNPMKWLLLILLLTGGFRFLLIPTNYVFRLCLRIAGV